MKDKKEKKWLKRPQPHDYPAAALYLSLIYDETTVKTFIGKLKKSPILEFKSKDIFRASGLSLLGISNYHVAQDRKKIKKGIKLSPLLLIRDTKNSKVIIADGYHRLCAVYSLNEDAIIPCVIA